jgi:hypothetical protein
MTTSSMFERMSLGAIEEVSGELHRRTGAALREIGELRADELLGGGISPRQQTAALVTSIELACITMEAIIGQLPPPPARSDRHPSAVAAVMYGAPSLAGLLTRLEQDRRMFTSLTRHLQPRRGETATTAWGNGTIQQLVIELAIVEPARIAQALEEAVRVLETADLESPTGEHAV